MKPKKISIILAHPDSQSFNHAIARTCMEVLEKGGHHVHYHDLWVESFDPLLPVAEFPKGAQLPLEIDRQCREIAAADGIIIVHPNWWGMPPAIMKGWIDRVIRPGVCYEFEEQDSGEGVPIGLLKAQAALVFNTSNTEAGREREIFGDPLETIWKNCVFDLCGVKNFFRKTFGIVVTSTREQREDWLKEAEEIVERYFPPLV